MMTDLITKYKLIGQDYSPLNGVGYKVKKTKKYVVKFYIMDLTFEVVEAKDEN